jgi:serine/threonine protein phosphatase PrpC
MLALMSETATVIRPTDDELDLFGITHQGKVRTENQDHFLVSTVHPQVVIHGTSLPHPDKLPLRGTRFATVLILADGVGGAAAGSEAASHPNQQGMATTLTVVVVVYPWAYVVQVGDSRCYFFSGGKLQLLTRDQTVAQALIDQGLMPAERLDASPFKHVLSSAIGSDEAMPVVTPFDISERGSLILMCSDGLTKHVSDEEIASQIRRMKSSEQIARDLLDLALERGGRDNITIIAARAPLKKS